MAGTVGWQQVLCKICSECALFDMLSSCRHWSCGCPEGCSRKYLQTAHRSPMAGEWDLLWRYRQPLRGPIAEEFVELSRLSGLAGHAQQILRHERGFSLELRVQSVYLPELATKSCLARRQASQVGAVQND